MLQQHAWTDPADPPRLDGQSDQGTVAPPTIELKTHALAWELRLTSGATLLQWRLCCGQDDVLGTNEAWKAAMIDKSGAELGVIVRSAKQRKAIAHLAVGVFFRMATPPVPLGPCRWDFGRGVVGAGDSVGASRGGNRTV